MIYFVTTSHIQHDSVYKQLVSISDKLTPLRINFSYLCIESSSQLHAKSSQYANMFPEFINFHLIKISESKKSHYRKSFWYFYGVISLLSGGTNLVTKGDFHWSFSIQFLLGLLIIILNFLNKIEPKTK